MRPNSALPALLGLILIAVLILGLYYLVGFGADLFAGVGLEVRTVTAVAAIALLSSAFIIAGGLHGIGRREDARQLRAARAVVYERFLREYAGGRSGAELQGGGRDFLPRDPHSLDQQMLLHASPEVLKAYRPLRRVEDGAGAAGPDAGQGLASLVRAMRRDLGHRSPDVGASDLVELMRLPSREHR